MLPEFTINSIGRFKAFNREYCLSIGIVSFSIRQYPTYYSVCYLWGLVDLRFRKEKLYESNRKPELFAALYNSAAEEQYNKLRLTAA